ncbi:tyrosine-type recombinase/integrase [Agromyces sp. S2-1-8]|uniref:tyrosine-type recombinase/integrase n=1 Tax=Agromyces sp. S2-1-8 TaxID=2897180 RepID=UPI001E448EA2|nr:tyrosine-type recombinase/integrase [Agromyces sp. S2-1-8]MCD5345043.1 tyrosine-type recombinase/integrase [Agromyces sp. S2-1-8]
MRVVRLHRRRVDDDAGMSGRGRPTSSTTSSKSGQVISENWAKAIDDYLLKLRASGQPATTANTRRQQLQHLARRVAVGPWELTPHELLEYAGAQDWAQETRRGRYSAFREFWKWGKATKRCRQNIAKRALPRVKASPPAPRPMPDAVYQSALRRADDRTTLILRLAHDAGLRRGEISLIHSDDLSQDFVGWSLLVHGKGNKLRTVPLTPRLALDLRALGTGWAFPGDIDGHLSARRVGELAVDVLPSPWTLHALRHSFATRAHEIEGDTLTVQRLLGHASPATTQRYVLLGDERLRGTVYRAAGVNGPLTVNRRNGLEAV